jgi:hypothetical protein
MNGSAVAQLRQLGIPVTSAGRSGQVIPFRRRRSGQLGGPPVDGPDSGYDIWADPQFNPGGWFDNLPPISTTPTYNPSTTVATGAATPIYLPQSSGNTFNSIAALISQGLQALAPHPSNQIVPQAGGLQIVANPGVQTAQSAAAAQIASSQALANRGLSPTGQPLGGAGVGSGLGQGLDGIISWATANPLPVFLIIGGAFLLFRDPPRSRR